MFVLAAVLGAASVGLWIVRSRRRGREFRSLAEAWRAQEDRKRLCREQGARIVRVQHRGLTSLPLGKVPGADRPGRELVVELDQDVELSDPNGGVCVLRGGTLVSFAEVQGLMTYAKDNDIVAELAPQATFCVQAIAAVRDGDSRGAVVLRPIHSSCRARAKSDDPEFDIAASPETFQRQGAWPVPLFLCLAALGSTLLPNVSTTLLAFGFVVWGLSILWELLISRGRA